MITMENIIFGGYTWQCCMEGGRLIHPEQPWVWYNRKDVSIIDNKVLSMGCYRQPTTITYWDGREYDAQYGGGLLRSVGTFPYGTFSAEIMLPKGKGLWPAFWLCGEGPWPESGEIDIMEGYTDNQCFRLTTPYFPWINPSWKTTTNVHYSKDGKHRQIGARSVSVIKQPYQPQDNFIEYKAEWTPDKIVFLIDGKIVRTDTEAVSRFSRYDRRMRVIFDCLCQDPEEHKISIEQPMYVRNFQYTPY